MMFFFFYLIWMLFDLNLTQYFFAAQVDRHRAKSINDQSDGCVSDIAFT